MFEDLVPLVPVHFFQIGCDCHYYKGKKEALLPSKFDLPDVSSLHESPSFSTLALAWSEKGIYVTLRVRYPLREVFFPDFRQGDSLELFFDTRDVKTSGFNTRFCSHFFFLPEPYEGEDGRIIQAGEVTRFRGEERHELADEKLLFVACGKEKRSYVMHLFIPKEALFGYEPEEFNRLGFTYRVNRHLGAPQFFSASDENFAFENHSSLWASLKLIKDK